MLVILGAFLALLGTLFLLGGRFFNLGRLPGDIVIRRGNFTFYFPLATCILLSLGLTILLWLIRRR
ncbi:MAG: DUF2905 domain-containing protein [Bacillota bacterium]